MAKKRLYYNKEIIEQIDLAFDIGNSFMLFGPPGSGKTSLVYYLAQEKNWELVRITGKESMRDEDMMGTYRVKGDIPVWVEGPLEKAFRLAQEKPVILIIDEITRIPSRYLNVFIEIINDYDYDKFMFYNNVTGKEWIAPKENLKFFATANVNQVGVNDIPEALLDRFEYHIYIDYPSMASEIQIAKEWGMSEKTATILVEFARQVRRAHVDGKTEFPFSTRNIVNVAKGIQKLKQQGKIKTLNDEIQYCLKILKTGHFPYICGASRGRIDWEDIFQFLEGIFRNIEKEHEERKQSAPQKTEQKVIKEESYNNAPFVI